MGKREIQALGEFYSTRNEPVHRVKGAGLDTAARLCARDFIIVAEDGRIVRIVRQSGAVETYVVAEPDKMKAVATLAAGAATNSDRLEPIGRASLDLLKTMGLAAGQFAKA